VNCSSLVIGLQYAHASAGRTQHRKKTPHCQEGRDWTPSSNREKKEVGRGRAENGDVNRAVTEDTLTRYLETRMPIGLRMAACGNAHSDNVRKKRTFSEIVCLHAIHEMKERRDARRQRSDSHNRRACFASMYIASHTGLTLSRETERVCRCALWKC
jgi:hypothetical protein